MITRWHYYIDAVMIARWRYCPNTEMVQGSVHWIVNVSNCK